MLTAAARTVLTALRDRGGICIDPLFPGECRQLMGNRGIRLRYCRPDGMTIDECGEFFYDRGFTVTRLGTVEVIDILEQLFSVAPKKAARARIDVAALDRDAVRARKNRNRCYRCPVCARTRCNGAVKTCEVACLPCSRRLGILVELRREEMTFNEVMNQLATGVAESAPF